VQTVPVITFVQPTKTATTVLEAHPTPTSTHRMLSATGVEAAVTVTQVEPTDTVTTAEERVKCQF